MAVFGSLRPFLNTSCHKVEQIVFSATYDCRKICLNTSHMGCAAPSAIPDSGNGCLHFQYRVDHQDEAWEQGRITVADCSSHANEPKMKRAFWSPSERLTRRSGARKRVS